jgi:hypothetical protein
MTVELPPVDTLSQLQVRGMSCVWCGVALDNATAVDLGARPCRIADMTFKWFPRSCPRGSCPRDVERKE